MSWLNLFPIRLRRSVGFYDCCATCKGRFWGKSLLLFHQSTCHRRDQNWRLPFSRRFFFLKDCFALKIVLLQWLRAFLNAFRLHSEGKVIHFWNVLFLLSTALAHCLLNQGLDLFPLLAIEKRRWRIVLLYENMCILNKNVCKHYVHYIENNENYICFIHTQY